MFESALFILGGLFLILSFFVGNNEKSNDNEGMEEARFLYPKEEVEEAQKQVSEEISTVAENTIIDTENKLSSMSNDTIIFVEDFAKQTLERIQHNHDEVVFMYNMLQSKEEDLKATERNIILENQKLEQQRIELENMLSPKVSEGSGIEMARRKSSAEKQESEKRKAAKQEAPAPLLESPIVDSSEFSNEDEENKTQRILELYRQNKSVLDISKQLGLGQGEVKLVIDLYGRA